ncbi:tetratricopeptide repeat protein [Oceaniglobus trochenteri]|uniref:tetratricopeptide repeat protein n=1 Tax=Oceaniglobus trochenteri TaxID=2763260 RepID=UPI001CFF6DF2|nr:tetratricopeptide repeat protein [Oceaniglobus trochenteri]
MTHDILGQATSLPAGAALDSWNATQMAFLAHGAATPTHLGATLAAAPGFALGHAVKGMFNILMGRRELMQTATEALAAARAADPGTPREGQIVDALGLWLAGDVSGALNRFETVLAAHPTDTLTLKLDHALRFVMGDAAGMRRMIEAALPAYDAGHPARGYVLGCHAFALEETGAYDGAQRAGQRALELCPDDAWGLHAVAHVHDMTADAAGGLRWLDGREAAWAHCNNFRYHVWWHKALMHLDLGQTDAVLALYDGEIRKDRTDDYRDISNATSLLMRLELDGVSVGDRWSELADLSAERTEDGCLVFADLHYMLALVSQNRTRAISTLMGRLHRDARTQASQMHRAMEKPGLSAAAGLEAFGESRFDIAFLNLLQARKTMQLAGGSHAQRDIFERLTIDSGIRAGFLDEAERVLDERTAKRAGKSDGYAAVRRALIARGRDAACAGRVPAE